MFITPSLQHFGTDAASFQYFFFFFSSGHGLLHSVTDTCLSPNLIVFDAFASDPPIQRSVTVRNKVLSN